MGKLTLKRVALLFICTLSFTISFSQQRKITGTVKGDRGTPLVGATVAARNTRVTTSYVGMVTQEVSVSNSNSVQVALASTSNNLTDEVVVGYGQARRANLTTAQTESPQRHRENSKHYLLGRLLFHFIKPINVSI